MKPMLIMLVLPFFFILSSSGFSCGVDQTGQRAKSKSASARSLRAIEDFTVASATPTKDERWERVKRRLSSAGRSAK
jgi:hypothetical protein